MKKPLLLLLIFIHINCFAQFADKPFGSKPEEVGLSSDSLNKMNLFMQKYVAEKKLPGMIAMIGRHNKLAYLEKFGHMSASKPMQLNAIFRIASMTKPITSVAIMILYDDGKLDINDPVEKYIPEFKNLQVLSSMNQGGLHLEAVKRPMTISQLLMHTSGLASGMDDTPIDSMYRAAGLSAGTLKDMAAKLSKIPLLYQPGTTWNYGRSFDVLAYIVEVVSGMPFDEFISKRIFKPLKMDDTGFYVPADKLDRVSSVYAPADSGNIQVILDSVVNNVSAKPTFLSGNGGLLSTANDYMIFCQMLLNKGTYNGVSILKSATVDSLTSDHITNEVMPDDDFFGDLLSGMGFGFGVAVRNRQNASGSNENIGSYWWSGSANTYFLIDPKEDLILILMTQFVPNYYYPVFNEFKTTVYKSIIK
ncbi:MAG TPA: serine hydrolase domain-containing protein [Bacteroidales bacterium]|nr:serine hydrolase domain-containing protein [Bacteroidales bacterium]